MCEDGLSHLAHDSVDHTAKQWTRFQKHGSWIKVVAGTQLVENFWHVVKHHCVPEEAYADATSLESYLLALTWRQACTGDPVWDLGRAVADYQKHHKYKPCEMDVYFTGIADEDDYQIAEAQTESTGDPGALVPFPLSDGQESDAELAPLSTDPYFAS